MTVGRRASHPSRPAFENSRPGLVAMDPGSGVSPRRREKPLRNRDFRPLEMRRPNREARTPPNERPSSAGGGPTTHSEQGRPARGTRGATPSPCGRARSSRPGAGQTDLRPGRTVELCPCSNAKKRRLGLRQGRPAEATFYRLVRTRRSDISCQVGSFSRCALQQTEDAASAVGSRNDDRLERA